MVLALLGTSSELSGCNMFVSFRFFEKIPDYKLLGPFVIGLWHMTAGKHRNDILTIYCLRGRILGMIGQILVKTAAFFISDLRARIDTLLTESFRQEMNSLYTYTLQYLYVLNEIFLVM